MVGDSDPILPGASGNRFGHHVILKDSRYLLIDSFRLPWQAIWPSRYLENVPVPGESDGHPTIPPPGRSLDDLDKPSKRLPLRSGGVGAQRPGREMLPSCWPGPVGTVGDSDPILPSTSHPAAAGTSHLTSDGRFACAAGRVLSERLACPILPRSIWQSISPSRFLERLAVPAPSILISTIWCVTWLSRNLEKYQYAGESDQSSTFRHPAAARDPQ